VPHSLGAEALATTSPRKCAQMVHEYPAWELGAEGILLDTIQTTIALLESIEILALMRVSAMTET